jgi:hypothetical protein
MAKFKISRAYVTRYEWTVDAANADDALKMLDDDENELPTSLADEQWQGPVWSCSADQTEDRVEEIS